MTTETEATLTASHTQPAAVVISTDGPRQASQSDGKQAGAPALKSAGHVIVDSLVAHGVERTYVVPGESFLDVLDGLHGSDIETIVCRHEGGAAYMAEADGKMNQRPGRGHGDPGARGGQRPRWAAHRMAGLHPYAAVRGPDPVRAPGPRGVPGVRHQGVVRYRRQARHGAGPRRAGVRDCGRGDVRGHERTAGSGGGGPAGGHHPAADRSGPAPGHPGGGGRHEQH